MTTNSNTNSSKNAAAGIKRGRILILEDEESVNRGLSFSLEKEGYEVLPCFSVGSARKMLGEYKVDLMLCDISLPDGNGLKLIQEIRKVSHIHIICLTALDQELDQVMGYEAGADDYVTKPFSLSVLTMKIGAYFKKSRREEGEIVKSGDLQLNLSQMRIWRKGEEISLTKNEWKLLCLLLEHPKQILSKRQILEQLFDLDGSFVDDNTVAVNIKRLREKIETDLAEPVYIKNVRGMGYLWNQECRRLEEGTPVREGGYFEKLDS